MMVSQLRSHHDVDRQFRAYRRPSKRKKENTMNSKKYKGNKAVYRKIKGISRGAAILIVPLLPQGYIGAGFGTLWIFWSFWE